MYRSSYKEYLHNPNAMSVAVLNAIEISSIDWQSRINRYPNANRATCDIRPYITRLNCPRTSPPVHIPSWLLDSRVYWIAKVTICWFYWNTFPHVIIVVPWKRVPQALNYDCRVVCLFINGTSFILAFLHQANIHICTLLIAFQCLECRPILTSVFHKDRRTIFYVASKWPKHSQHWSTLHFAKNNIKCD